VHDAKGNLVSEGGRSLAYDSENRLVGVTVAGSSFGLRYDPVGRLASITAPGPNFVLDVDGTDIVACAPHPGVGRFMSYDECATASNCRVEGVVSLREVDHVWMGHLALPDGKCVSLSLPAAEVARVRRSGPRSRVYAGRVYPAHPEGDVRLVSVGGRRVGLSQCGDFYVFVR
jgi:YD repeat-containing protein